MESNSDLTSPILVTGGTGTLGTLVVDGLRRAGRTVRVLSRGRRPHGAGDGIDFVTADLSTGEDVAAAVAGTEVVVHCAGSAKGDDVKARHLVEGASRTGVRHIVYISVVGDERVPMEGRMDRAMFGYFGAKRAAEEIIVGSGIPFTILHATQFHDLSLLTATLLARLPIIPVPSGSRFQPIDTTEVAERLIELALGQPAGVVPDLGGPRIYEVEELLRSYLRATGRRRLIVSMTMPGAAAAAIRAGANLAPGRAVGRRTWEEFLASRVGSPGADARISATP